MMRHLVFPVLALAAFITPQTLDAAQVIESALKLDAPIKTWDEAIPLGNGLMGGLLWGEGSTLRLSLDRGDLWDERVSKKADFSKLNYATLLRLKAAGKYAEMAKIMEDPYRDATPTKLPGGRVEFDLDGAIPIRRFTLNFGGAEARVDSDKGLLATAYAHARRPAIYVSIPKGLNRIRLMTTADVASANKGAKESSSAGGVALLGYPEAVRGESEFAKWYVQPGADGFKYCVYVERNHDSEDSYCVIVMTSTKDAKDPLAEAKKRAADALREGYDNGLNAHRDWWRRFWEQSRVSVPDAAIQRQYDTVQYLLGSASRVGSPPMPLQGVWTADNGQLPPWKGDYHNDLNTQMTYISYQAAGRFSEGYSYLDFLWQRRARFQKFAKDVFGTGGGNVPGVMTLEGNPLGGWGQYSLSPTMGAWSAHLFYLHWRYTADAKFLAERAYPWCTDVGVCIRELLKPDASGRLVLPLSSSPEIFDNSPKAWLTPNSNYDLMSCRMLFLALKEMAASLDKNEEAEEWGALAEKLGDYHTDDAGTLLVSDKTPLPGSHRHLSNIIGLYPFNLITTEGSDKDRERIAASLAQWDKFGTRAWCGYSFGWMACLRARVGDAEAALKNLSIYTEAFVSKNGFHLNGDQLKKGYSGFTYRPFTLEGNFLAAQAVQEMLIQSWSPSPGEKDTSVIRFFPAIPKAWKDVSFEELAVEGGHRVSAQMKGGKPVFIRVIFGRDDTVRVRDNFGESAAKWSNPNVKKSGKDFVIEGRKGQIFDARF